MSLQHFAKRILSTILILYKANRIKKGIRHLTDTTTTAIELNPIHEMTSGSVADELQKYQGLLEQGVINAEEFDEIKRKLIDKL